MGTYNRKFIDLTRDLIFRSPNRETFVEAMIQQFKSTPIKVGEDVHDRLPEERMRDQLTCGDSWLGKDESFEYPKPIQGRKDSRYYVEHVPRRSI